MSIWHAEKDMFSPRKRRVELRFAVHALMAASAYLFIAALVIAA